MHRSVIRFAFQLARSIRRLSLALMVQENAYAVQVTVSGGIVQGTKSFWAGPVRRRASSENFAKKQRGILEDDSWNDIVQIARRIVHRFFVFAFARIRRVLVTRYFGGKITHIDYINFSIK